MEIVPGLLYTVESGAEHEFMYGEGRSLYDSCKLWTGLFNDPCGEQNIVLVTAPEKEYSSLDEFVSEALDYLDSDDEFADDWKERYKNRTYSEVRDAELEWMLSRFSEMSERVSVLHGPVVKAVHIIQPEWNDITLGIETLQEYMFYRWGTSA